MSSCISSRWDEICVTKKEKKENDNQVNNINKMKIHTVSFLSFLEIYVAFECLKEDCSDTLSEVDHNGWGLHRCYQ